MSIGMVNFITDRIDIWTSAQIQKTNGAGRGNGSPNQNLHGIKKLRELILELAVRGKLVSQDPNDEPASVLLENIAKEKARLIKEGKIKKQKSPPEITENDKLFDLPAGWEWARLPEVSDYKPGKTPSTKNPNYWSDDSTGIPWVSISDMNHFGLIKDTNKRITNAAVDQVFKYDVIPIGALLMSFKLTVGKISILNVDAYHNEAIISIQPFTGLSRDYLFKFLPKRALAGNTKNAIMGNTLNADSLALLLIPIPPQAEQNRIVAKVDELMALCDQLEKKQTDINAAHQTLVETLLTTLTAATNQGEFTEAWQRIANHFDILFTTEQSIDQLKQTILQLAVMGILVPQDPNDEPASELLEKIVAERERLVKEGEIKKEKPLPEIDEDEKPFELPEGWVWARLQQIIHISSGDGLTAANMNKEGGIPVYGGNGVTGYHDQANVTKPTLVIGRVGFYCGSIHITPASAWVTDNAFKTTFSENNIYINFLFWLLKGTNLKENENATAQPVISGRKVYPIVIGLPPTAEQHRIVAKVNELMAICDTLKARINDAQATKIQLADVIVEQAVA